MRVHWTVVLWPAIFLAGFVQFYDWPTAVLWGLVWTVALYAVTWTHEMGHIVVGRRFGVPSRRITLWGLGGLAHADADYPNPRAEIVSALAGPATHLIWLAALGVPFVLLGLREEPALWAGMLERFLWMQAAWAGFNLLPSYPLDGGRVFRAALARRMHPNRASLGAAYVGYAGAAMIGLAGLTYVFAGDTLGRGDWAAKAGGPLMVWMAISFYFACRRLHIGTRWSASPYAARDSADWWRQGAAAEEPWQGSLDEAKERRSRSEERRERRVEEARRREEAERRRLQERIDQLLDRINEVGGVENLAPSERRELAEASELLRRETAAGG